MAMNGPSPPAPPPEGEGSFVSRLRDFHDNFHAVGRQHPWTGCLRLAIHAAGSDATSEPPRWGRVALEADGELTVHGLMATPDYERHR